MAANKQRISVIRIPRQVRNQSNPNENPSITEPDSITNQLKPPNLDKTNRDSIINQLKLPNLDKTERDSITNHLKPPHLDKTEPDATVIHVKPYNGKRHSNKKEQNDVSHLQTDVFTRSIPRISITKSDDLNLQNSRVSRPSSKIQQQPTQTKTWIQRSPVNPIRPELNWKPTVKWSHGLCALLEDSNMCFYACGCWCCFRHEISAMMGEHWCVWFLNCAPLMELRTKFRQQYAIEGSIAGDCCLATFCPLCVALQLANEGRDYGHRIFS